MPLNFRRQIHIHSPREKSGGMGSAEHRGILMISAGDINQIYSAVNHLGQSGAVFQIQADLRKIITRNSGFDGEMRSDAFPDRVQSQQKESGAILKGTAEFIGTPVPDRRQKLREQPSMGRMYLHHVKSCLFAELCRFFVGFYNFIN